MLSKLTKDQKKLLFALIVTGVYLVFGLILAYFHEPWRDEAQAWLIARDLSPAGILAQMAYEGTPALWHFILYPFAKLGAPYFTMQVIHVLLAAAAIFVFTRYSSFSSLIKILLPATYIMGWEYLVIARNYVLTVLLLFITATLYDKRHANPWLYAIVLALLANSTFFGIGFAAILGSLFVYELYKKGAIKQYIGPILVVIFSIVIAAIQAYPAPHFNAFQEFRFNAPIIASAEVFFNSFFYEDPWIRNLVALGFLLLLMARFLYQPKTFAIFSGMLGFVSLVLIQIPIRTLRHEVMILFVVLFSLWIAKHEAPRIPQKGLIIYEFIHGRFGSWSVTGILLLSLMFQSYGHLLGGFSDIEMNYSNSRIAAKWIEENVPDETFVTYNSAHASALLPYLPDKQFWSPEELDWVTFQTWEEDFPTKKNFSEHYLMAVIEENFPENPPFLLLSKPLARPDQYGYGAIYTDIHTPQIRGQERYTIYAPMTKQ